MLTRVHSVTTAGLDPVKIDVEITTTSGIPQIFIIGIVNTAAKEAKDRVITALKSMNVRLKARKTVISLVPADVKKTGTSFDLAIAVALLSLYRKIAINLETTALIGEISIDGSVEGVSHCLGKVLAAQKLGYKQVIVPVKNLPDCILVEGITILGITHLNQVLVSEPKFATIPTQLSRIQEKQEVSILGQSEAVRAVTIAIAGKHHLHLVGPPGIGKSTLPLFANALQPTLSKFQALEVSNLYSLKQETREHIFQAPFRTPHHTSTVKKIIGYDTQLIPGEVSLSHHGVLFLDELPLFSTGVLQALRNPIDKKVITLQNHQQNAIFPCHSIVIAASNPCPCGFWQSGSKECSCSAASRNGFKKKLSWPLLERFDLQVFLTSLSSDEYGKAAPRHNSTTIAKQVQSARMTQQIRYKHSSKHNSDLRVSTIPTYCSFDNDAEKFLKKAVTTYQLSTRGYEKVVGVAQTIADLENSEKISISHCAEALQYRPTPL